MSAAADLLPDGIGLEAQIETARGLVEAERIAAAGHGLEALVFGPADLAASLGVPVLTIGAGSSRLRAQHASSRPRVRSGLQAVDGPHARLGDDLGLVLSARRALEHGYDGKWVIHPSQIEPVNNIFTPSVAELERARRILEAAAGCGPLRGRARGRGLPQARGVAAQARRAALLAALRRFTSGAASTPRYHRCRSPAMAAAAEPSTQAMRATMSERVLSGQVPDAGSRASGGCGKIGPIFSPRGKDEGR